MNLPDIEMVSKTFPEGDRAANGLPEVAGRELKGQTRVVWSQFGRRLEETDPLLAWIPRHAANCLSRYRVLSDGLTPDQRRAGRRWRRYQVVFGENL